MTAAFTVMNTLTNCGALLVLNKADFFKVFEQDKLNAFMMMFLKLNNYGQGILEIFWTPLYFTFGLLIIKTKYLPRVLGYLLIIASSTYLNNTFTALVIPQYHLPIFTKMAMAVGGLAITPTILWLLIEGIKVQQSDQLSFIAGLSLCLWLIMMGVTLPKWEKKARVGPKDSML